MKLYAFVPSLLIVAMCGLCDRASARGENVAPVTAKSRQNGLNFIENKGQWTPEAKYKADIPEGVMFITDKGFVYHYVSNADMQRLEELSEKKMDATHEIIHHYAYKVNFVGANPVVKYLPEEKRSNYNNYFIGNDRSKWASRVGLYGKILQQNVYNGIDVSVYSKGNSLKYDFVLAPGADPGQIKLSFEGVVPEITSNGDLRIKTTINEIIEKAPYAYQIIDGKETAVAVKYLLKNNLLSFAFPDGYDTHLPLIIDPILVFATYSGGTGGFFYAHSTTYGIDGSMFVGAFADGPGWPTTTGAFQVNYPGGNNCVSINKYNATGSNLIYSTYYGGTNGATTPNTMRVNAQDELVVAGGTTATDVPFTTGAYDSTFGGSSDIFVAHFTDDGTALLGATYMGGNGVDAAVVDINSSPQTPSFLMSASTSPCEIIFDDSSNIWVVSNSNSGDFPVTANALQSTIGGSWDGVLFKLDPTCSNLGYSTYMGGNNVDAIYNIGINSSGKIVVCGGTQSNDFPTTTGALNTSALGGGWDGFASIIDPATGSLEASTFLGTNNADNATKLQVDGSDDIYILGRTQGAYTISPGVWSITNGDVYIDKLNADLSASLLSTRVGKTQSGLFSSYLPTAFLLDMCGNVYVAGMTSSINPGMPLTPDAFDTVAKNFWFCVIKPNFTDLLFGTYFGSDNEFGYNPDHAHTGTSRFDPQGVVYHSVCSTSQNFPTTPGSWSETKQNGGNNDIASFKFDFEATGVQSHIALSPGENDSVCVPYTLTFDNNSTSPYDIDYVWDFGDGSPTSVVAAPSHTFNNPGVYNVVLHAHSDSACITDDYDTMRITVLQTNLPQLSVRDTTVCDPEQAIDLTVTILNPSPNNIISWTPASGIIAGADQPTVTVDPSASAVYYVTVKDTIPGICGFSSSDTVHIDFSPRALHIITPDTTVCEGAQIQIAAVATPGYQFNWSPGEGISDTTALTPVITVHQSETYTLTASHPGCPDTAQTLSVTMQAIPHLDLGPDVEACQWQPVALQSHVTPFRNDYSYQWTPANGLQHPDGPDAQFNADTSGTWVLAVSTPIGCADTDTVHVTVYPGNFGSVASDTGYCPPGQAPLWAAGGTAYHWTPAYGLSDTADPRPVATPQTTTQYTVFITNEHGCTDTGYVTVQVYPLAVINVPDSITVYPGEQYHLEPATNCVYFNWFPTNGISSTGVADPVFDPAVRTRYFVTATTENGCVTNDSIDVLVAPTVINMPNAFTPGQGTNSIFYASKRGIARLKDFSIYNRWGNKVFSTTDINHGWDGTFNGQPQPMGVYIYVIQAVTDSGKTFTQNGNVTLIR